MPLSTYSEAVRERPVPPPKPTRKGPPKRDPDHKIPVKDPPPEAPRHPPVREPPDEAKEPGKGTAGIAITHPSRVHGVRKESPAGASGR